MGITPARVGLRREGNGSRGIGTAPKDRTPPPRGRRGHVASPTPAPRARAWAGKLAGRARLERGQYPQGRILLASGDVTELQDLASCCDLTPVEGERPG
jgi:hypothetical protein